jgi:hypothetical protein
VIDAVDVVGGEKGRVGGAMDVVGREQQLGGEKWKWKEGRLGREALASARRRRRLANIPNVTTPSGNHKPGRCRPTWQLQTTPVSGLGGVSSYSGGRREGET